MDRDNILEQAENFARLLRSLMRELTAGLDDPAVDLPLAQLRVCTVLHGGPRPMSSLGRELGVSLSAITQIADRLERAGLVERVTRGNDRRVRCLQLTVPGKTMMVHHGEVRMRRMTALLEHLTPKAREEAAATLEMLIRAAVAASGQDGDDKQDGNGKQDGFPISTSKVLL